MKKYIFLLFFTYLHLFAIEPFIKPTELQNIIEDKNLLIIDVSDYSLYKKGHILHSLHFDVSTLVAKQNNPYMLPDTPQNVQNKLKELGINKDTDIVIYSHNSQKGLFDSTYLAFVLIQNGVKNISILDGGYMGWVFQNDLLVSQEKNSPATKGDFDFYYNKNMLVDYKYVQQNQQSATILDAREPSQYFGVQRSKSTQKTGHIPTAQCGYYKYSFLSDFTIRDDEDLKAIYTDGFNLDTNSPIIIYADDIYQASVLWYIVYKKMGFENTKLYGASLKEWVDIPTLKLEKFKWH